MKLYEFLKDHTNLRTSIPTSEYGEESKFYKDESYFKGFDW